ncbi:DUF803-domain-containing protein [Aspergillus sclerotioniger CBS 115572]|uniref:DUF803-domain-containing protein n=1 Tax=Aspergillus sclerotioniger CBS 115572 TaxID=1450535 RepID=A0A317WHT5_9EURO|nr:DUF803-domain-containing protein [Aspergillus sclerotioniger CBS 115572]PWY85839.1 DUF803-domain-containing protein [Aspergillus sclerotioniger CBS 115572]
MAYLQEVPLAAVLLTALASSAIPSPPPTPYHFPSSSQPSPTFTPSPGSDDGGGGSGGGMHEWSSLIGIVTALAGNVLISLALNIQRYAHIRIDKEWEQDKLKQELDWKRTNHGHNSTGAYGTVDDSDFDGEVRQGRNYVSLQGRYRDESPSSEPEHYEEPRGHSGRNGRYRDDDTDSQDHMQDSMISDRTARPGSDRLRRKSYLRSPYWWAGIVLMSLGEVGNFMAYGFAPASIVSPLGVVALISNCVIAPIMLKEKFRQRDLWGVLIAIAGAAVVVLSANSSEEKIGPHDIWEMITRWEFELYMGVSAGLIVGLMYISGKYGSRSILIDVGLVALFGGYTALSTKGVSSLLSFTLWHVITFPVTYLLVFVLVFSALMQIRYINRALQRFDSTQVIPTQFVLFTLSVIIGSAVLYRDFESFTAERGSKFVGGCLLTFLGVYFITSGRVRADNESSFSVDDEEEAIGLLAGERYRDSVDMPPPGPQGKVHKTGRRLHTASDDLLQSPSGSLLSHGIEDVDDNQRTPRGILSVAPSSPGGSLTADSLEQPSSEPSSPLHARSLLTNPWADTLESAIQTPNTEPAIIHRPATPPTQSTHAAHESPFLLRFPPAPGAEDGDLEGPTPGHGRTASNIRRAVVPQTPPARHLRNSISKFSPGPLLPTISAGFSAVVAETLRRGEISPSKGRRLQHRMGRRKQLSTTVLEGFPRHRGRDAREPEYDSDGNGEDGHDLRFPVPSGRLRSSGDLATAPLSTGNLTPGVNSEDGPSIPRANDATSLSRLRSLSDSWSGGLAWLGGVLHKPGANRGSGNTTSIRENEHEHSMDTQGNQEGQVTDADTRA